MAVLPSPETALQQHIRKTALQQGSCDLGVVIHVHTGLLCFTYDCQKFYDVL